MHSKQRVRVRRARNATIAALRHIALSPLSPAIEMATRIETEATLIAGAMASIHGGDWRVQIEHQAGFVLVVRR